MPGRGHSDIEERLDESELRLKLAIRAAGIGIWDCGVPPVSPDSSASLILLG
jgi:hypothetical protein